ncbi:MAG: acylneuraminate cytidylyltransferase [Acidobacteria bacterium]|nr:acylneuraminate cytidylyltransferase [Acidobacteriota bacterium]
MIPARGGSKGVPGKNLRPLGGVPLLVWSLRQAAATSAVTRIVVSTDDPAIADIARREGAEVVERPVELAGDTASSESALVHALKELEEREGYSPDLVVFLQATSPLRRQDEIQRALETLDREGADSLFSASVVHGFVWRHQDGELRALTYDHLHRPRRQDIGEDLLENGSIYIFKPWVLERHGNRLGGRVAVHRMDPLDSFQVDTPEDLELMERLLQLQEIAEADAPDSDLAAVELLVLDFDGVMTDDRVLVDQDGKESVLCHRGDGMGIERLRAAGVEIAVLSKEKNPVVSARCRKLGIPCHQGYDEKLGKLQELAAERNLGPSQVAYAGNDVNDLGCLGWVGWPFAVGDARPEVRAAARFVTRREGGRGAVREICDLILTTRGRRPGSP